jgi:hypothetical protein
MKDYSDYYPSYKDKLVADAQKLFNLHLNGIEGVDGYIDGIATKFVLQRRSNLVNQLQGEYYALCDISINAHTGSILIDNQGVKYLAISNVEESIVYKKFLIRECNQTIQLNKNGILSQVPCVVESSVRLYQLSVNDNKYFSELGDNIVIRMQNNATTVLIELNEVYSIGKWKYEITNISDIIEPGLLVVKMQITSKDVETIPTPEPIKPITITGDDSIVKGKTAQYATDYNGDIIFSLEGNFATIINQENKSCNIQAGQIISTVKLWCRTIDGLVEGYKDIKIKSRF